MKICSFCSILFSINFFFGFGKLTSTILGQEVAELVFEDVHVRAGYLLGIWFFGTSGGVAVGRR